MLYLGHVAGVDYGPSGAVGPLRGTIGVDTRVDTTGNFRAFLINDVLLIPAGVIILARVRAGGLRPPLAGAIVFVMGAAYFAHSRGIWLGIALAAAALLAGGSERIRSLPAPIQVVALCLVLFAFVVNAAPQVARPVANAVTGGTREISSSSRLTQGPHLISGAKRHLFLGSGLGATLPSGYTRSTTAPWSFELAWLQLIFQTGVVGLVSMLGVLTLVLRAAWRTLPGSSGPQTTWRLTGFAGLLGFVFTCGSNPYLVTSVGALTLAIMLTLCGTVSLRE
jgi:hypothetical protein